MEQVSLEEPQAGGTRPVRLAEAGPRAPSGGVQPSRQEAGRAMSRGLGPRRLGPGSPCRPASVGRASGPHPESNTFLGEVTALFFQESFQ